MIYLYGNEETNEEIELDYPAGEAPTTTVIEGVEYRRLFRSATRIPEHMKAGSDSEIKHYDRKDWGTKKFY